MCFLPGALRQHEYGDHYSLYIFHVGFDDQVPTSPAVQINFKGSPESIAFSNSQEIFLMIEGQIHSSIDETFSTTWSFNGGDLPSAAKLVPLKGPLLSVSQSLEIGRPTILDSGTYDVSVTIDPYTHLFSHLECPFEYHSFIAGTIGIGSIILDQATVHLLYYGKILV